MVSSRQSRYHGTAFPCPRPADQGRQDDVEKILAVLSAPRELPAGIPSNLFPRHCPMPPCASSLSCNPGFSCSRSSSRASYSNRQPYGDISPYHRANRDRFTNGFSHGDGYADSGAYGDADSYHYTHRCAYRARVDCYRQPYGNTPAHRSASTSRQRGSGALHRRWPRGCYPDPGPWGHSSYRWGEFWIWCRQLSVTAGRYEA